MKNNEIRAVIIDDEKLAISALKAEVEQFIEEITIIGTATTIKAGVDLINQLAPELVFLDIQLKNGNGFEVIKKISNTPHIIFTTAYSDYAIEAIRHAAFDYLLKPIDYMDIKKSLYRYKEMINSDDMTIKSNNIYKNKLAIRDKKGIHLIDVDEVLYCQSNSNYSIVYLENNTRFIISKTLKILEETYNNDMFLRVHQSYLINSEKIKLFDSSNSQITLTNGLQIPVSVRKKKVVSNFIDKIKSED